MKVSCICATYNRPLSYQWLIEEAVESFLRQDYVEKELLILNDCPGQELVCDAPDVLVVNFPRRFHSHGEKLNAGIALATGDLLTPWDDDDIMLPWRLSKSVERLADADYFNSRMFWLLDSRGLHKKHCMGVGQNGSIFKPPTFDGADGYPPVRGGADALLDPRLRCHPPVNQADSSTFGLHEWHYIYRWGVSPTHLSSREPYAEWYQQIGKRPIEQGRYLLSPHWKEDYLSRTREAIARNEQL